MLNVQRISHLTLETPDLERLVDYQVNVLGLSIAEREHDRVYLKTATGQLATVLNRGSEARCSALAFQVEPGRTIQELQQHLFDKGLRSETRVDSGPGIGEVLSFKDPNGTEVIVFTQSEFLGEDRSLKSFLPLKLGHVAFKAKDVAEMMTFYQTVLGFRVSDWRGDFFVWMRCGPDHHTTNFVRGDKIKMHHMAFEVADRAEILRACDFLGRNRYPIIWGPGRHIIGDNIFVYHRDPDGNIVELYTELARMDSESLGNFMPRPWRTDHPYKPSVWAQDTLMNLWGPGAPPGFGD